MYAFDIDSQAAALDDIWFAYLEWVSDVTRITVEFFMRLGKDMMTRIIYGDLDVPFILAD